MLWAIGAAVFLIGAFQVAVRAARSRDRRRMAALLAGDGLDTPLVSGDFEFDRRALVEILAPAAESFDRALADEIADRERVWNEPWHFHDLVSLLERCAGELPDDGVVEVPMAPGVVRYLCKGCARAYPGGNLRMVREAHLSGVKGTRAWGGSIRHRGTCPAGHLVYESYVRVN